MSKPREFTIVAFISSGWDWIVTDSPDVYQKYPDYKETENKAFEEIDGKIFKINLIEKAPVDKLLDEVEKYIISLEPSVLASAHREQRHVILKSIKEFRSNE